MKTSQETSPMNSETLARRRHECASNGHCSNNGDGCSCSDEELRARPSPSMNSVTGGVTRYRMEKLTGSSTLLPCVREDGDWVKYEDFALACRSASTQAPVAWTNAYWLAEVQANGRQMIEAAPVHSGTFDVPLYASPVDDQGVRALAEALRQAEAYNAEYGDPADTLHHGNSLLDFFRAALAGGQ